MSSVDVGCYTYWNQAQDFGLNLQEFVGISNETKDTTFLLQLEGPVMVLTVTLFFPWSFDRIVKFLKLIIFGEKNRTKKILEPVPSKIH